MWSKDNPSPAYLAALEEAKAFHKVSKAYDGRRTFKALAHLESLCRKHQAKTLLDYGCGKGAQYAAVDIPMRLLGLDGERVEKVAPTLIEGLGVERIGLYDPAVVGYNVPPPEGQKFDGVFCVDVFQVIPEDDVPWVVAHAGSYASKFLFIKFRITDVRDKKTTIVKQLPFERWLELFEANTPRDVDVLIRAREPSGVHRVCRRRPDEETFNVSELQVPGG